MEHGILPNHSPNNWPPGGMANSLGRVFLCTEKNIGYWALNMYDSLIPPTPAEELVALEVLTEPGSPDPSDDCQEGDCYRNLIPIEKIGQVLDVQPWCGK